MKNPKKVTNSTRSKMSVGRRNHSVDSREAPPSGRSTRDEFDGEMREALSRHLHELLNSLWPAAARIELAITEETCPPKFRKTLEELGRDVEEAMTIAARTSELVDSPTSKRVLS